jgi:hypothetical protein
LKKPTTKKGWWSGSNGKSACVASVRPSIQTPGLPKKKKKEYTMGKRQSLQQMEN